MHDNGILLDEIDEDKSESCDSSNDLDSEKEEEKEDSKLLVEHAETTSA